MSAYSDTVAIELPRGVPAAPPLDPSADAFHFGGDHQLLAWGNPGLPFPRRDPQEADRIRDVAWRRVINAAGGHAVVVLLEQRSDRAAGHAFLIGFDTLRNEPARTGTVLSAARSIFDGWKPSASAHLVTVPRVQEPLLATTIDLSGFARSGVICWKSAFGAMLKVILFQRDDGLRGQSNGAGFDARLLEASLPLMHASIEAFIQSMQQDHRNGLFEGLLDTMSAGIVLLDDHCTILFRNAVARGLIEGGKGLVVTRDGELRCATLATTKLLAASVREVIARPPGSRDPAAVIRIAGNPLQLGFVTPAVSRAGGQANRCAMLLVPPAHSGQVGRGVMTALGLLPCEQRFLQAFLSTASLLEAAAKAGVSEETARTYLKRIRSKLGVHRQMELVQLLSGLVPPLRQTGDALAMVG